MQMSNMKTDMASDIYCYKTNHFKPSASKQRHFSQLLLFSPLVSRQVHSAQPSARLVRPRQLADADWGVLVLSPSCKLDQLPYIAAVGKHSLKSS